MIAERQAPALAGLMMDRSLQIPDEVRIVGELPHTATGKVSKRTLREQYAAASRLSEQRPGRGLQA